MLQLIFLIKPWIVHIIPNSIKSLARNKVITTRTSVRNHTRQLIITIENNTVRTRRTTSVRLAALENRELVVRAGNGEIETLVVVVGVRVAVVGLAGRVQVVAGGLGGTDGAGSVADGAAGVGAGALLGGGDGGGDEEGGEGQDLQVKVRLVRIGFEWGLCLSYLGVLHLGGEIDKLRLMSW